MYFWKLFVIFLLVAQVSVLAAPADNRPVQDLPRYLNVAPGLFRGGQPSPKGLQELKDRGIKTVISLRHDPEDIGWEKEQVEKQGMKFINMPMDGRHQPSDAFLKDFLAIVTNEKLQPVFVHCELGQDRTGVMMALFREAVQGWTAKSAYEEMVRLGFNKHYVWLADSVFDYEEEHTGEKAGSRPYNVRAYDSLESTLTRNKKNKKPE